MKKYEIWRAPYECSPTFPGAPNIIKETHMVFTAIHDMDDLRDVIRMVELVPSSHAVFGIYLGDIMTCAVWCNPPEGISPPVHNQMPFAIHVRVEDPLFSTIKDPELMVRRILEWPTK